jgi:hypothetical protein
MSVYHSDGWILIDGKDINPLCDGGENDEQQETAVVEGNGNLTSPCSKEDDGLIESKDKIEKAGTPRVRFAAKSEEVRQRAVSIHIPTPYPISYSDKDTQKTTPELVHLADLAPSASSIFTNRDGQPSPRLQAFDSRKNIEESRETLSAVLYSIPKENRQTVWTFLHEYVGSMNLVVPCAILLVDATSEFFAGCAMTTLSWDKYIVGDMLPRNQGRLFGGESVSYLSVFVHVKTNSPLPDSHPLKPRPMALYAMSSHQIPNQPFSNPTNIRTKIYPDAALYQSIHEQAGSSYHG